MPNRCAIEMNIVEDLADGDFAAMLEFASLTAASLAAVLAASSLIKSQADSSGQSEDGHATPLPPPLRPPTNASPKVAIDIDLGPNGQPTGVSRLFFKPLLPRSQFLVVNLTAPLGLVIEERESDAAIVTTGTLPGYGAAGTVAEGALIRAVTAYAEVIGDAPMWQQVTSGTPIGDIRLARLVFSTEGATYVDVRDAIASHKEADGSEQDRVRTPQVTLVLERAVNATASVTPRGGVPALESLADVLKKDLSKRAVGEIGSSGKAGAIERARRALGANDDVIDEGMPQKQDWW